MMVKKLLVAGCIALSFNAFAYELYNPQQSYSAGAYVTLDGKTYLAKWWVAAGQRPDEVVANPWDSPWELVSNDGGSDVKPDPAPQPDPEPEPEPEVTPSDYPPYQEGTAYKSGDIVSNAGKNYRCKEGVAAWCSGLALAYEPGIGHGWESAWSVYRGDSDDGGNEPAEAAMEISQSELDKTESQLTSSGMMKDVMTSVATLDNDRVEKITAGAKDNPGNVRRVENILGAERWDHLFPHRDPAYTYDNFLKAVGKFPRLCGDFSDGRDADQICRKTLATMFAHFAQETGEHNVHSDIPEWRQGLHWVREMGWVEGQPNGYNGECNPDTWQGKAWPCGKDSNGRYLSYFGRGAKQLSYNYNYGPFSEAMFGDVSVLLNKPELVADTWLNLASAIFFYIYPQPPKPSMQFVIDGTWQPNVHDKADGLVPGFGVTTQIINGGVECGGSVEIAQSLNRIKYYEAFAKELNVPVASDEVLGCKNMKQFSESGSGALPIYWEQDWSYNEKNPGGKSYACQLVGYQTAFTAFRKGDYTQCVKEHFPDLVITDK
ncbi:chitinase [Erwinia psidii]|uniref:Chitinase n=1 Tax=Erwinia psidii TaxID=69224 RepID=A0A3N6UNP1_9GAMM|nr:chitinase [Erwinia psidii]MCX8961768.1 chitinase [Erwinia psidii]MCX8965362.1 chitinase [Erwinia psidii]RQM37569.1 chitinase [Erwinia psidii]